MSWLLWGILGAVVLVALWAMGIYNRLVAQRNQVKNAWSQIDVQLQRRNDLIPNLVESVKGYMDFERGTLEAVIKARNQAVGARDTLEKSGGPTGSDPAAMKQLLTAETGLKGAMTQFFALAENYPQLKASENMKQLQEELSTTENKVAFSRQAYNDQVMIYNTSQQEFPATLLAATFGHHSAELYEVQDAAVRNVPKVSF